MKEDSNKYVLESIGLCLLGFYFLMASIYQENFSKTHLFFIFLNFPIFIGEIVLLFCVLINLRLIGLKRVYLTKWGYLFIVYLAGILLWTGYDYIRLHGQALALRNAVLFFYPIFAFFAYSFYYSALLSKRFKIFLIVFLFLAGFVNKAGFFSFIYFILTLVALRAGIFKSGRYMLGLGLLLLWPYSSFLSGARTWLVASMVTWVFLIFVYVRYFLKLNNQWKIALGLVGVVILLFAVTHFADKGGLLTLTTPKEAIKRYENVKLLIKQREGTYHIQDLHINLYNSEKDKQNLLNVFMSSQGVVFKSACPLPSSDKIHIYDVKRSSQEKNLLKGQEVASENNTELVLSKSNIKSSQIKTLSTGQIALVNEQLSSEETLPNKAEDLRTTFVGESLPQNCKNIGRDVDAAYDNIFFRLLIWQDMIKELWESKNIFGVGMGHPQRSRSIEILNWAPSEWKRDGWITPHNSFLHLIYRGGVVGIAIICATFIVLYGLIRDFIRRRCIIGLLLSGILIYGLVAANFLLILELPYYAIPFWIIFGLTLAHRRDLLKEKS